MESEERILRPPTNVRGMLKLEKEKFEKSVLLPVVKVDACDIGTITRRVRLEKYLIGHNLKPLKNIIECEEEGKKLLVFHPHEVTSDEIKERVIELFSNELGEKASQLTFEDFSKTLTFENWDSKLLIKSVIPENADYSSYTQTGHIVHCNFPDNLLEYRFVIAEILLAKVKNCRTVVQKANNITNVYRNLTLELLAGVEDYVTELREEGLRYKLDFSKVYWNSRLSHEHARLIKKLDKNSLLYDACCGIGPFVLPAAIKRKPRRILANDLNPDSIKWLKTNILLNKVKEDNFKVHNLDAVEFIRTVIVEDFIKESKDASGVHIPMNLPAYAVNFLPAFKGILRGRLDEIPESNRCSWNVYCYLFAKSHVDVDDAWFAEEARRMANEKLKWNVDLVVDTHNVRTVSSRKEMFCVEISLPYEYLTAEPDEDAEPEPKKARMEDDDD